MSIRIVQHGCGGFLYPPTYPDNFMCIEHDGTKKSLTASLFSDNVAVKIIARRILDSWDRGDIDINWVRSVLGYYKNAWRNPAMDEPNCWFNCNIFYCVEPIGASYLDHFGVHWIQRFYPDYFPTEEDFLNAKWDGKLNLSQKQADVKKNVLYSKTNPIFNPSSVDTTKLIGYNPNARLPAAMQKQVDCDRELCGSSAFNLP